MHTRPHTQASARAQLSERRRERVSPVASRNFHTALVLSDGHLVTFGSGSCGQLGVNGSTADRRSPMHVQRIGPRTLNPNPES